MICLLFSCNALHNACKASQLVFRSVLSFSGSGPFACKGYPHQGPFGAFARKLAHERKKASTVLISAYCTPFLALQMVGTGKLEVFTTNLSPLRNGWLSFPSKLTLASDLAHVSHACVPNAFCGSEAVRGTRRDGTGAC